MPTDECNPLPSISANNILTYASSNHIQKESSYVTYLRADDTHSDTHTRVLQECELIRPTIGVTRARPVEQSLTDGTVKLSWDPLTAATNHLHPVESGSLVRWPSSVAVFRQTCA